jgi:hypothetical protein
LKSFIFFQTSYLFESEPQSSIQINHEKVVDIKDTKIPVKSLIPKNENKYVDIIAQKEWQLAYTGYGPVKYITDGTFIDQYHIKRDSMILMKIPHNKKGEITYKKNGEIDYKMVYPSVNSQGYLKYKLYNYHDSVKKNYTIGAHRLFGMIFNDNDDIFRYTEWDHIDRFLWDNIPINTSWATPVENQNNPESCGGKINRKHDKIDIKYLEKWIEHVKKIPVKKLMD